MKKGALSSTFERDVCPIRQITPWEASKSHLRAAPKRMSILMRTKFGSHLEKSLSARFPLVVDNNRRYASRLTTRKKATRQAVCCELGFLIRADWEKLAGSHPDSHIGDICPRRRVLGESGHEARFLLAAPGAGSHNLTADSHSRKGVRRAPGRSCAFNSQGAALSPAAGAASRRLNEVEKRRLHRLFKPFNLHRLPSPCGLPRLHGPFGPPRSFGLLGQRRSFGLRGLPGSDAPIA